MAGFWSRIRERLFGPPPDYSAIWADVRDRLSHTRRVAWQPRCEEGHDPNRRSHFGGRPLLSAGAGWPSCGRCRRSMPLLLQVASVELPDEARPAFPTGLLQLFFCIKCFDWEPFSDGVCVRVLEDDAELTVAADDESESSLAERTVVDWKRIDDYPEPGDSATPELGLDELQVESLFEAGYPLQGDKLLGAPYWVQDPERPPCPECEKPMKTLFQLDSNDNLDLMWGDAGVAHVLWCADHQQVLTLVWQCH